MLLVAVPATLVFHWLGIGWPGAILLGSAAAFSSTVLVFKTLAEVGQTSTPQGRRAVGILLFQDMALVPLLLIAPMVTGDEPPGANEFFRLAMVSTLFVAAVLFLRRAIGNWLFPWLTAYRSPDLMVLMTVVTLGLTTLAAHAIGLPAALGAFAAGLMFGGNRWSAQIDALVLPFRETFAAVFFIALGLLLDVEEIARWPVQIIGSTVLLIALKAIAAIVALRLTGLPWRTSLGMGVGLAHVGEFAFLLTRVALQEELIAEADYQRFAAVAFLSLVATPLLLRAGLRLADAWEDSDTPANSPTSHRPGLAIVVGVGPVGKQVASYLDTRGIDVAMIDRSPVNLYPFSQFGFHTVAGDATDVAVLKSAHLAEAALLVVCVPADDTALRILQAARAINPTVRVLVRCRFEASVRGLLGQGAELVVSEEQQAYNRLIAHLERDAGSLDVDGLEATDGNGSS